MARKDFTDDSLESLLTLIANSIKTKVSTSDIGNKIKDYLQTDEGKSVINANSIKPNIFYPPSAIKPIVTFIVDGTNANVYDKIYEKFKSKGVTMDCAVSYSLLDKTGYLTVDNCNTMKENGMGIINNSYSYSVESSTTNGWVNLYRSNEWNDIPNFKSNGWWNDDGLNVFVYPDGVRTNNGDNYLRSRYAFGVSQTNNGLNTFPLNFALNRRMINTTEAGSVLGTSKIKSYIDECIATSGWLILGLYSTELNDKDIETIGYAIDYTKNNGISILTTHEALKYKGYNILNGYYDDDSVWNTTIASSNEGQFDFSPATSDIPTQCTGMKLKTNKTITTTTDMKPTIYPETCTKNILIGSTMGAVTIDNNYNISPKTSKQDVLLFMCDSVIKSLQISVNASDRIACTNIELNDSEISLLKDNTYTLTTILTPTTTTDLVSWSSSNESIATVDDNGVVTYVSDGTCTITASCNDLEAHCIINTTSEVPCTAIAVTPNGTKTLTTIGETLQLTATVTPANTTNAIVWSSSKPSIATISNNGLVTAIEDGTCWVQAKCNGKISGCTIIVDTSETSKIACTGIELNQTTITSTEIGSTHQLTATVTPENTTESVSWESTDANVATVSSNGLVTTTGIGTCTILATCGSQITECTVNVTIPCTSVSFSVREKTLTTIGEIYELTATVAPENTTDKVIWSISKSNVVSLATNGNTATVTALADGSCTIKAKCGSKESNCKIYVNTSTDEIACTGITLSESTLTFSRLNSTETLTTTVTPTNTTDTIVWSSSDETVATVENGKVTSIADGTCTITATCGGYFAECEVTINNNIPCTNITVSPNTAQTPITIGSTLQLTATVTPANTTDTIVWSSDDEAIATVDSNGVVTGVELGTCNITATCGSKSVVCVLTVAETVPCTKITADPSSLTFNDIGSTQTITLTLEPSTTTDTITWQSNNSSIAKRTVIEGDDRSVDVTSVGDGECYIIATSSSGIKKYISVSVSTS